MIKKIVILILALLPALLFAQEGTKAGSLTLYDSRNSQPFTVNSDGGWMDISPVYSETFSRMQPPLPGTLRKWRVKTSYIDESRSMGQSTLQVKLRPYNASAAVFTLPWTEKASRWQEKNSNWYTPYSGNGMIIDGNGMLSVRLIAPPRSSSPGRIYKIELEAWDFPSTSDMPEAMTPELNMAFTSPTDFSIPKERSAAGQRRELREKAEAFAMEFVEANISGDLPAFYKSLSQNLKILETGLSKDRYRVAPPAADLSSYSLADYKRNYRPHLYSYEEYAELFPQWFEEGRRWSPDENCYLFLGTEVLPGKSDFMNGENLVFMIRFNGGDASIIALPE